MTTIRNAFYAAIVSLTMSCSSGGSGDPAASEGLAGATGSDGTGGATGSVGAGGATGSVVGVPLNDAEELPISVRGVWTSQDNLYLELGAPLEAQIWRLRTVENCHDYLKSTLTFVDSGQYRDDQNTSIRLMASVDGNFLDFITKPVTATDESSITLAKVVGITTADLPVCTN